MILTERRIGDVTLLELSGRLVLGDGDTLFRSHVNALIDEGRVKIIVDLKDITYIDSCGVGGLVAKFVSAQRRGGDIRLLCLSPRCQHVLTITNLLGVFRIFDAETDALASFADGPTR